MPYKTHTRFSENQYFCIPGMLSDLQDQLDLIKMLLHLTNHVELSAKWSSSKKCVSIFSIHFSKNVLFDVRMTVFSPLIYQIVHVFILFKIRFWAFPNLFTVVPREGDWCIDPVQYFFIRL